MLLAVTAAAALLPSVLLVWFFRARDVHPEPAGALWATFGLGILSTLPTVVVALPLEAVLRALALPAAPAALLDAFFCAALPEEFFKLCVLLFYVRPHRAFDEPMDGIVYGVVASLGFATFENVLYTAGGGLVTALLRAFTAVPMHAACGAIMGYYVGQASFAPNPPLGRLLAAYLWPVLIHGVYDAPLLWMASIDSSSGGEVPDAVALLALLGVGSSLLSLGCAAGWSLLLVRRLRREQLRLLREGRFVLLDPALAGPAPVGRVLDAGADTATPAPPASEGRAAWPFILAGGAACVFGGLVLVASTAFLALGDPARNATATALGSLFCLGLFPLGAGLFAFARGVSRLGAPQRRLSPYRRRTGDAPS
ncbi:MAG: protease PrsW [Planctomycetota bacterium]|nr:MAG: protease PrsW [Planctomycetota bacterium]